MNEIVQFSQTEAGLTELRSRLKGVVYDVTTTVGMESARKDRRECVTLRTNLDKLRLELNADDQARIKARNERAKELATAIFNIEDPIDSQIKAEEDRKEAIRLAKLEVERARVARIRERISAIGRAPVDAIGLPLPELRQILDDHNLVHPPTAADFEELLDEATAVWQRAGEQLQKLVGQSEANAAEQIRLARDRQAFEQERLAQDERDQKSKAAADADAKAAKDARDRADREAKEVRDKADEEAADARAAADRKAEEERQAERRRIADERAENDRKAAELRQQEQERQAAAEAEEKAARKKHNDQVNAKLTKLREHGPGMAKFIAAAIIYRDADAEVATERLVDLCELYTRGETPAKATKAAQAEARA